MYGYLYIYCFWLPDHIDQNILCALFLHIFELYSPWKPKSLCKVRKDDRRNESRIGPCVTHLNSSLRVHSLLECCNFG